VWQAKRNGVTKAYAREEEPPWEGIPIKFTTINKNGARSERCREHLPYFGCIEGEGNNYLVGRGIKGQAQRQRVG
jgi:hypothetical protein